MGAASKTVKTNSRDAKTDDAFLNALVNTCEFGMIVTVSDRLKVTNSACLTLLGLDTAAPDAARRFATCADLLKASAKAGNLPTDDLANLLDLEQRLRETGASFTHSVRISDRLLKMKGTRVTEDCQSLSVYDITDEERQESRIRTAIEEAELAKAALNQLAEAVVIKNDRHEYVYVNEAYCKLHQLPAKDLLGKKPDEVFDERLAKWIVRTDDSILASNIGDGHTEVVDWPLGVSKYLSTSKTLFKTHGGARHIITLLQDVTQQKHKERQLSKALEKAELSQQVLEQLKTPVIVRDENHVLIMMNQAYADFLGVDRESLIGSQPEDYLPQDLVERAKSRDSSVLETGNSREDENIATGANGETVYTVTIKGPAVVGDKSYVVSTFTDITRYKRQEARLKDALEKAHLSELVLDQLGTPVHVKDQDLRYIMINKAYSESFGVPKEALVGKKISEVLDDERSRRIEESDRFVFTSSLDQEYEGEFNAQKRVGYPTIIKKKLAKTDQSHEYLVTVFHDISRLKEKERQLRSALAKAELSAEVLDQLPYPVAVKDAELRFVMANEAFCRLHGMVKSDLLGKSMLEVLPPAVAEETHAIGLNVLNTGQMIEQEGILEVENGREVHLLSRDGYLHCAGEDYVVTTLDDVTKLRRQEDRMIDVLRQAEIAEAVMDQIPTPIIVKDLDLRYVFVNKAFSNLHNLSRQQLMGKTVKEMFTPEEAGLLSEFDKAILESGVVQEVEHEVKLPDGKQMISLTRKSLAKTKAGDSFIVTVLNKIDRQKKLEHQLAKFDTERELAVRMLDAVPEPITAKDADFRFVVVNHAFSNLVGRRKEDLIGRVASDCLPAGLDQQMHNGEQIVLSKGQTVQTEETFGDGKSETSFIATNSLIATKSGDRFVVGVFSGKVQDNQRQKELETELQQARQAAEEQFQTLLETKHDSLHDVLTGLPNRRYLDQKLAEWTKDDPKQKLAALQIDLDRFKDINDTLGHAAGDHILRHVADVLRANCQDDDFVARIGGDEFVILRHSEVDHDELEFLADQIITEFDKPVPYENDLCRFGASIGIDIGIASTCEDTSTPQPSAEQLMMNADVALYRAKQLGRGRFTFFSKELQKEIERTKRISDDILLGLEKGEFFAVYQPQFDAKTLQMIGVEALARWKHPVLGVLAPTAFLDIARQLGVSDQIDHAILEAALADMHSWEEQGSAIARVAVNVSAQRLANPFLINLLKKLGIPSGKLAFEVHESTMLDHANDELKERIRQIADLGIDIEIDNFGTGQSSFLGMWSASPKRLKIDRGLVIPIATSVEHRRLLQAVVDMGRAVNLEVVSEGVETIQHVKLLREIGCDVLQGYALAKPMTSAELIEFSHVNQKFAMRG